MRFAYWCALEAEMAHICRACHRTDFFKPVNREYEIMYGVWGTYRLLGKCQSLGLSLKQQ